MTRPPWMVDCKFCGKGVDAQLVGWSDPCRCFAWLQTRRAPVMAYDMGDVRFVREALATRNPAPLAQCRYVAWWDARQHRWRTDFDWIKRKKLVIRSKRGGLG